MSKKSLWILAGVTLLLAPLASSAETASALFVDSSTCKVSSPACAPVVANSDQEDFLAQLGVPEPIQLQGDTWKEYRWSYDGCCTALGKTKYRQQVRTCSCCYMTPPTTRCTAWASTTTTKCENTCMQ